MANWAETCYYIAGDKSDLERLYNTIDKCFKEDDMEDISTPGGDWEEVIVQALGATEEQIDNSYLRGYIKEYEWYCNTIYLAAEEAWRTTDFRFIIQQLLPSVKVYFMTEEPGCEVYVTNDADWKYFPDRFYIESCINGNIESDYFSNESDAWNHVSNLLGVDTVDKEVLKEWNEKHHPQGDYVYLHEFEIVD